MQQLFEMFFCSLVELTEVKLHADSVFLQTAEQWGHSGVSSSSCVFVTLRVLRWSRGAARGTLEGDQAARFNFGVNVCHTVCLWTVFRTPVQKPAALCAINCVCIRRKTGNKPRSRHCGHCAEDFNLRALWTEPPGSPVIRFIISILSKLCSGNKERERQFLL